MGFELDANSIRELRLLRAKVKAMTVTPPAPLQRMKTREIQVRGLIPVLLSQTGGSQSYVADGMPVAATWRYQVSDLAGNVLALDVPLFPDRILSTECTPATSGAAVYAPNLYLPDPGTIPSSGSSSSSGGSPTPLRLWIANEIWTEIVDCIASISSSSSGGSSSSSS